MKKIVLFILMCALGIVTRTYAQFDNNSTELKGTHLDGSTRTYPSAKPGDEVKFYYNFHYTGTFPDNITARLAQRDFLAAWTHPIPGQLLVNGSVERSDTVWLTIVGAPTGLVFEFTSVKLFTGMMISGCNVWHEVPIARPSSDLFTSLGLHIDSVKPYAQCTDNNMSLEFTYKVANPSASHVSNASIKEAAIVYPNPAKSELNIQWEFPKTGTIVLYNSLGQKVLNHEVSSTSRAVLNIRGVVPGFYLIVHKTPLGANPLGTVQIQ